MPKKAGPSLLCEWMVGTTIQSALGPPPKPPKPKSKRRDVIKLHVTTDDESGEDTLTVTYPRPERLRENKETPAAVSKTPDPQPEPESEPEPEPVEVKTSVTFCEEEETQSESTADVTSTSASSGEATPEASSSNASSAAETSSAGETSSESEGHGPEAALLRRLSLHELSPPNLIAPIRAEVMQTERVVETQDDPPPNAYYDALHGVVRVYHGSHAVQNPYYHGYNNVMPMPPPQQHLPPHGYEHVPITQGMPMPGWNAMVPPPGYPPYNYPGLHPMSAAWYDQQLNKQGTKGAFNNNVMPEATKPNPYYTKRQSPFSNMGSNRSVSNGKPPSHSGHSNCSKNGNRDTGPNWDTNSRRSVGAWANSSNHGGAWGDGGDANNNNNQGGGDQWGSGGNGGDTWGTTNNNNDQWGNNNNDTGADQWGTGAGNDQNNQGGWGLLITRTMAVVPGAMGMQTTTSRRTIITATTVAGGKDKIKIKASRIPQREGMNQTPP
ncbi:hypothetical protein TrVFT333_009037 [Trichoderma virens FT-333]|nr:hypothetical protein TrVFT333_009037 [Trichoderma virens FT-333]